MVFNGLKGADLVVYNALREQDLPGKVSTTDLSFITGYAARTIIRVLERLEAYDMITRRRDRRGHPYTIEIKDDYAFPNS